MKKIAGQKGYKQEIVQVGGKTPHLRKQWKRTPLNTHNMRRILTAGDTHMMPQVALDINQKARESDAQAIIQVGDFGYKYDNVEQGRQFLENCSQSDVPWIFIRGNHDDTNWLKQFNNGELVGTEPIEVYPNVWWCPDGTLLEFENKKMLMVGGAVSVDAESRQAGIEHWDDEGISYSLLYQDIPEADILVSHDVPSEAAHNVVTGTEKADQLSDGNRKTLQVIFEESGAKIVVHGHYHHGYENTHGETMFVGLGHENSETATRIMDV